MQLQDDETILKVFHHHPTPFLYQMLKALGAVIPIFFVVYFFKSSIPENIFFLIILIICFGFALTIVYLSLIYWLDKLVITNKRVVHIDWKLLTVRAEAEARHHLIQDIITSEKGLLSHFKFFDYGTIQIDTSSSHHVSIVFEQAPDPEGIRRFVYHIKQQ